MHRIKKQLKQARRKGLGEPGKRVLASSGRTKASLPSPGSMKTPKPDIARIAREVEDIYAHVKELRSQRSLRK